MIHLLLQNPGTQVLDVGTPTPHLGSPISWNVPSLAFSTLKSPTLVHGKRLHISPCSKKPWVPTRQDSPGPSRVSTATRPPLHRTHFRSLGKIPLKTLTKLVLVSQNTVASLKKFPQYCFSFQPLILFKYSVGKRVPEVWDRSSDISSVNSSPWDLVLHFPSLISRCEFVSI